MKRTLLAGAVALAAAPAGFAQSYLSKPIRLVVGFTPGGEFDKYVAAERTQWAEVVKTAGAKVN
jgi:tripartite-type tricarboxylate transporter receptor subunit TctC